MRMPQELGPPRRTPRPLPARLLLGAALALVCVPGFVQENLVDNGEFERRSADGWAEGWEKLEFTADCTIELADAQPANSAVRIVGKSKLSKGGLRAPLKPFDGPPVVRIVLRYRGAQGKRSVIIRPTDTDPKDTKTGERLLLPPAPDWRPGGGMLKVGLDEEQTSEDLEVVLLHEGPGETWFDSVQVSAGSPTSRPAQAPAAPAAATAQGPYLVGYCPEEGSVLQVNPPRFRWPGKTGNSYTVEWSQSPQFPPESTQRAEGLTLNLYIPAEPLAPGQWYWRVSEAAATAPVPPDEGLPPDEGMPADEGETAPTVAEGEAQPTEEEPPTPPKPGKKPKGKKKPSKDTSPAPSGGPPGSQAAPEDQSPLVPPKPAEDTSPAPSSGPADSQAAPEDQSPPVPPKPRKGKRGKPKPPDETAPAPEDETPQMTPEETGEPVTEPDTEEAPGNEGVPYEPPARAAPAATSTPRSFRIADAAATVSVPPVDAVVTALPSHPRVWVTLDSVVSLRASIAGPLKEPWEALLARLNSAKGGELAPEPKGKGKWRNPSPKDLEANQQILDTATKEAGLVRDFAFAAMLSGDQAYADEAKRRALNLAAWDAKGSTGYVSHDQAFREILLSLALTVDWLPQSFSEEEKGKIVAAIAARGEELHKALGAGPRPLNLFPYSSHGETAVGFLAVVSLATAGDVPEAAKWLQFSLPAAVNLFSPWAGDDGGWMQGETYWKRSAPFTFQLFDALKTAAGIDLYHLPWSANTARYKTYMHPPYSTRGGFGDGPEVPPDAEDRLAMWRLASALKDSTAAWYAASVSAPAGDVTAFDILWRDPSIQPQAPEGLPPAAAFLDSGLFAMHSSLTDPQGVHLYGRASPFGSFNHAHADQGHFTLDAFGEPLLIDAGYYDWYRSPHASSFSRTTLAHSTLLVNGNVGQRTDDITAKGKIESFVHTDAGDYAQVQAAEAYPPQMLESFQRQFVYLRPNWIVIFDHVKPNEKASFAWLLHSLEQPTLDSTTSTALIRRGNAAVGVGAFGPDKLAWTTTKAFPKNPRFTESDVEAPPQWHTTIKSRQNVDAEDLVMLVVPFQGEAAPTLKALEVTAGRGGEAILGEARLIAMLRRPPPPPPEPKKPPPKPKKKPVAEPTEPPEEETPAPGEPPAEAPEAPAANDSGAPAGPPPEAEVAPADAKPKHKPKQGKEAPLLAEPAVDELPPPPAPPPPMVAGDLTADADRLCLATAADGSEAIFAQGLKSLARAEKTVLSCTVEALVLGTLGSAPSLSIDVKEQGTITLALAAPPTKLLVDGAEQPAVYADGVLTVQLAAGRHEVRIQP